MLIYITTDFEDFERGVPVKAGTLLDYTDKDRAGEIIRAGFQILLLWTLCCQI